MTARTVSRHPAVRAELARLGTELGRALDAGQLRLPPTPGPALPRELVSDGRRFVWSPAPGGPRQQDRLIDLLQDPQPLVRWMPARSRLFRFLKRSLGRG